jgi:dihydrofolate reductase
VDGFIEGPNGEMDWAMMEDEETWRDVFEMLAPVDTFILGRKMYQGYEQYWLAVLADPGGILPFSGRVASKNEIAYARLADSRHHIVLSRTLNKIAWKATRIVKDVEDIRKMKQQPGKDMFAVGGATLICSLMNLGLIDELRLLVNPPYSWRWNSAAQRCKRAAFFETHTSEAIEIREGQLDLQYMILKCDDMYL